MSTLLLSHPACLNHLTPSGHPERPDRLRAIEQALEDEKFQSLARVEALAEALDVIAFCHPMEYVEAIRDASPAEGLVRLDADTAMSPGSFEAALRAVGGAKLAVDEMMTGKARKCVRRDPSTRAPYRNRHGRWDSAFSTTRRSRRATRKKPRCRAGGDCRFRRPPR